MSNTTHAEVGLYLRYVGPPGSVPIVFLHPSGSNATAWDAHLDALARDHRCVAVDLPGHRHSRAEPWSSLDSTAERIGDLIAGPLGGRAHLVGLSLGGSVALTLLEQRPQLLDHVIIDGAAALPNRSAWLLKTAVTVIAPVLHTRPVVRAFSRALGVADADRPTFEAGIRAVPPPVFRRAFCQAQDVRITPQLLEVDNPTLLVAGERDPGTTRTSNATLAHLLPHAEARFCPGAGHDGWPAARTSTSRWCGGGSPTEPSPTASPARQRSPCHSRLRCRHGQRTLPGAARQTARTPRPNARTRGSDEHHDQDHDRWGRRSRHHVRHDLPPRSELGCYPTGTSPRRRRRRARHTPQAPDHPAITIDAPPEGVWPWLVQMGWGRAGWYTYRWVDQLLFPANRPSAEMILPQYQDLAVGDRVLDGPPGTAYFTVQRLEPARLLVLRSTSHIFGAMAERGHITMDWAWTWQLTPLPNGRTRLLQRNNGRMSPPWAAAIYIATIVPADFIMARSHLRGIKQRAERSPALETTA